MSIASLFSTQHHRAQIHFVQTLGLIPEMGGIYRLAVLGAAKHPTRLLKALFVRVVAVLAQRLPVGAIPEQLGVTVMSLDVIDHRSLSDAIMALTFSAQRMLSQPTNPGALPAVAVHAQSPLRRVSL